MIKPGDMVMTLRGNVSLRVEPTGWKYLSEPLQKHDTALVLAVNDVEDAVRSLNRGNPLWACCLVLPFGRIESGWIYEVSIFKIYSGDDVAI